MLCVKLRLKLKILLSDHMLLQCSLIIFINPLKVFYLYSRILLAFLKLPCLKFFFLFMSFLFFFGIFSVPTNFSISQSFSFGQKSCSFSLISSLLVNRILLFVLFLFLAYHSNTLFLCISFPFLPCFSCFFLSSFSPLETAKLISSRYIL